MDADASTPYRLPALLHGADYNYEQWLDEPRILDDDFRLMREAGMNAMSVGIFSWSVLEPVEGDYRFDWMDGLMDRLAQHEIHAILATPSGARPPWLSARYPEVRQVDRHGRRQPHAGRHNHCRTSPVYRDKCVAINTRLAERYRDHPALLLWHVSNEYGAGTCHCELCYGAFRRWLRARYGDLDTLDRAWWTTFWSHRFTDWDQIEPVDPSIQGLMLDWQRFTSDQTLDFFLTESAPLREITPDTPITTNFMQPDVGLDYWDFAPHVDVIAWDSYPRWHVVDDVGTAARTAFYHDLHRSYKGGPFMLMESTPSVTNWQGVSRPKRPGMHVLSSLQAVAHGSDTVQYFQWRQGRGGTEQFHGAVMTHANRPDTRVFRDVQDVSRHLARIPEVRGAEVDAEVAVVYDYETEWMLNHVELPQNEDKRYQERCRAHHEALWRLGVATDVVNADLDFGRYSLVVAPMLFLLRPGTAERIEAYVRDGGVFVATYLTGIVGESGLAFLGGMPEPLRRTLGVEVLESDTFAASDGQHVVPAPQERLLPEGGVPAGPYADVVRPEGAEALALYAREHYRGTPAITRHAYGEGQAYYLATRLNDEALGGLYARLRDRHDFRAFGEEGPEDVSVRFRRTVEGTFAFVLNFGDEVASAPLDRLRDDGFEVRIGGQEGRLEPYGTAVLWRPARRRS